MDREEILKKKPGWELNELAATQVLQLEYKPRFDGDVAGYYGGIISEELPDFSGDWFGAGVLMEWLVDHGHCPALLFDDNGHWTLALNGTQNVPEGDDPQDIDTCFFVEKDLWFDSAAEAICKGALVAVMGL